MKLTDIYQPIKKELDRVEGLLESCLGESENRFLRRLCRFLMSSPGKRLRPALAILSARATSTYPFRVKSNALVNVAAAVELIHLASLIHDDVIDRAALRHNKPTVNRKWGNEVSIALGDYLYSAGFCLISKCGNADIIDCIGHASRSMCEGELIQVCKRQDFDLLKKRYILIVRKKTASLFAASCQAGAMLVNSSRRSQLALREYGLNFGIAFQIIDDCLDLAGKTEELGKSPGADFKMEELTLPLLNLLHLDKDKSGIICLLKDSQSRSAFSKIRQRFIGSAALVNTEKDILFYLAKARESLDGIDNSSFKQSLFRLTDYAAGAIRP